VADPGIFILVNFYSFSYRPRPFTSTFLYCLPSHLYLPIYLYRHYYHINTPLYFFFHRGTSNNNLFCYILQSIFYFLLFIVLIIITVCFILGSGSGVSLDPDTPATAVPEDPGTLFISFFWVRLIRSLTPPQD
jgi:hypothetical protein